MEEKDFRPITLREFVDEKRLDSKEDRALLDEFLALHNADVTHAYCHFEKGFQSFKVKIYTLRGKRSIVTPGGNMVESQSDMVNESLS